jgi:hypothetical protein
MNARSLSVVIAVQMAQQNLPEIMRHLACERHPEVEFLVCYTDADPDVPRLLENQGNIRMLQGLPGSLIPQLWRDGILAAHHATVAITTAHCIPDEDWLQCLLQTDLQGVAGIGGVIENHPDSDARGWAIYMLRYISFAPPQAARRIEEIAADNAVYRRTAILQYQDLLQKGFWEPSFHARFRAAGLFLALDPRLRVTHHNRYSAWQFFGQRFAHGREFGLARADQLQWFKRILLIALSPLLPLVFLRKIVAAVRRQPQHRRRLGRAFPWLCFFLLGWGLGEARGYMESIAQR